jgi:hypothetical protein
MGRQGPGEAGEVPALGDPMRGVWCIAQLPAIGAELADMC